MPPWVSRDFSRFLLRFPREFPRKYLRIPPGVPQGFLQNNLRNFFSFFFRNSPKGSPENSSRCFSCISSKSSGYSSRRFFRISPGAPLILAHPKILPETSREFSQIFHGNTSSRILEISPGISLWTTLRVPREFFQKILGSSSRNSLEAPQGVPRQFHLNCP